MIKIESFQDGVFTVLLGYGNKIHLKEAGPASVELDECGSRLIFDCEMCPASSESPPADRREEVTVHGGRSFRSGDTVCLKSSTSSEPFPLKIYGFTRDKLGKLYAVCLREDSHSLSACVVSIGNLIHFVNLGDVTDVKIERHDKVQVNLDAAPVPPEVPTPLNIPIGSFAVTRHGSVVRIIRKSGSLYDVIASCPSGSGKTVEMAYEADRLRHATAAEAYAGRRLFLPGDKVLISEHSQHYMHSSVVMIANVVGDKVNVYPLYKMNGSPFAGDSITISFVEMSDLIPITERQDSGVRCEGGFAVGDQVVVSSPLSNLMSVYGHMIFCVSSLDNGVAKVAAADNQNNFAVTRAVIKVENLRRATVEEIVTGRRV